MHPLGHGRFVKERKATPHQILAERLLGTPTDDEINDAMQDFIPSVMWATADPYGLSERYGGPGKEPKDFAGHPTSTARKAIRSRMATRAKEQMHIADTKLDDALAAWESHKKSAIAMVTPAEAQEEEDTPWNPFPEFKLETVGDAANFFTGKSKDDMDLLVCHLRIVAGTDHKTFHAQALPYMLSAPLLANAYPAFSTREVRGIEAHGRTPLPDDFVKKYLKVAYKAANLTGRSEATKNRFFTEFLRVWNKYRIDLQHDEAIVSTSLSIPRPFHCPLRIEIKVINLPSLYGFTNLSLMISPQVSVHRLDVVPPNSLAEPDPPASPRPGPSQAIARGAGDQSLSPYVDEED